MATLPKPKTPLKILTIDGGELEGPSTLLMIHRLLDAIARNNGVPDSKLRPCDVFDVIAGIGPGGWLALLLGRFQMDIEAALAEWYNLIDCIGLEVKGEGLRPYLLQHSCYDTDKLVKLIDGLTEFYETDKHMFFTPLEGTRCKHVFVSALKSDWKGSHLGNNLFRTYDCPKGSNVLEGPPNPREYKISHAFEATGADKYFKPHRREPAAIRAISKILDIRSQSPHNITELALNEMWGLYGKDVEIAVVVNIGPGIPNNPDLENVARSLSWGTKETKSPTLLTWEKPFQSDQSHDHEPLESSTPVTRQTTSASERNVKFKEKPRTEESKIEFDIREKLRNVYPEHTPPYYRLLAAEGFALSSARSKQHQHPPITAVDCKTGVVNVLQPQESKNQSD